MPLIRFLWAECQTGEADPARLSHLLQRCRLGRSARMPPKVEDTMVGVGIQETGGGMTTTPKVAVEDMREEAEEDMEAEEEAAEGGRCREAGEMEEEEEGEAVTIRATIKMQGVIRGEEGEVVTEGTTKEASRMLATMEEEEALTMTTTTKMETGIRREVGVEEVGEAGEEEVEEEEDKEEAGEGEEARILTKEVSLNSSFSTAGSTTTRLVLIKADTTQVEDAAWGTVAESIQIDGSSCLYRFEMPYLEFSAWLKVYLNIK